MGGSAVRCYCETPRVFLTEAMQALKPRLLHRGRQMEAQEALGREAGAGWQRPLTQGQGADLGLRLTGGTWGETGGQETIQEAAVRAEGKMDGKSGAGAEAVLSTPEALSELRSRMPAHLLHKPEPVFCPQRCGKGAKALPWEMRATDPPEGRR